MPARPGTRPPNAGKGRVKGVPNKHTAEVKEWAANVFNSEEWRESARKRMIQGRAPHLESHVIACLFPKPKDGFNLSPGNDGAIVIRWAKDEE